MQSRAFAAFLLSASLAVVLSSDPTLAQQPAPKDSKGPTKPPEPKWPDEIGGKSIRAWIELLRDPDPAIRQAALNTIPSFGPEVSKKEASHAILARLKPPSEGGEKDPGVRITLYDAASLIGFAETKDEVEAIRLLGLSADKGSPGGLSRRHAIQTLATIGPKAEPAVYLVAGVALQDPSYETRQAIARCLGQIGMNETKGPNVKALQALAGNLAKDESVAVRMEALQALVMLGPPWENAKKAGDKTPPKINQKAADFVADAMRARLGVGMGKTKTKEVEMDKQLEIWCRVVLMRFDPTKEINDENLAAIARHCAAKDDGPKVQALQALAIFGEQAAPKVDSVVSTLDSDNPLVLSTALSALASMGVKAEGAIPELEKQEKRWLKIREDKMIENLKDKKFAEAYDKLMQKEKDQVIASMPQEQVRLTIASTIKWIKDSKPGMPGGDRKEPEKK